MQYRNPVAKVTRRFHLPMLLISGALSSALAYAQPLDAKDKTEFPIAQKYVKSILAADLSSMSKLEDDAMKRGMTKELVTSTDQKLAQALGALKSQGNPRRGQPVHGFDVVYVPCTFERGKLDLMVSFDASYKVAGCVTVAPGRP